MRTLAILLLVSLGLQSPETWPQNKIPIQIVVEDLSGRTCGLTRDAISGRVKITLRQYGFTETEYSRPYIYVNLNAAELDRECVGNLTTELIGYTEQDFANGSLGWVKKAASRRTILSRRGNILMFPSYEFSARLLDAVEAQVKHVLSEIEY